MLPENKMFEHRIVTAKCNAVDARSIESYKALGGYQALRRALQSQPADVVNQIKRSGLKGRGGAGFSTGLKLESVNRLDACPKYLVCNADEGEPGNFKDRYLMEHDPHQLLEGMIIGAYAAGATRGYIYIRGEYDQARDLMELAVKEAKAGHLLGNQISGTDFSFEVDILSGAGAYICGEEFALIESIEGKAGRPRNKPPYPTLSGVNNKPTVISNVETISNIPYIVLNGPDAFTAVGTPSSTGTRLVSLSGNVKKPGVYEVPFGTRIRDIVFSLGGGVPDERAIRMVQIGGASGPCIPPNLLDLKMDYAEFACQGLSMGSGAVIVIDERFDILDIVRLNMRFFKHESCGKCTPCREGIRQILRLLFKFKNGSALESDLELLQTLCHVMIRTSFCGLGQAAPTAVLSTIRYFRDEYIKGINNLNLTA
ncbi:MAG: NADH-quinone oxidoreductase subunit F [Clostridiaceae bacterium]|nr:NADH-quinone oxidoreductase subunit F [Clostridiaceae bacterium]